MKDEGPWAKYMHRDHWGQPSAPPALELKSLRGGGATALLLRCNDLSFIQRRGGWASLRSMEVYLQELSAVNYTALLDPSTRARILELADGVTWAWSRASELLDARVPAKHWTARFADTSRPPAGPGLCWRADALPGDLSA